MEFLLAPTVPSEPRPQNLQDVVPAGVVSRLGFLISHSQKFLSFSGIFIFLSDIIFCLTAAVSVIILLFHLNGGEIRGFALFGAALGFTAYYFTLGKLTVLFSDYIIRGIKRLILLILSVTVIPIIKLLRKPIAFLARKTDIKIRKIKTAAFIKKRTAEAGKGFGII